MHRLDLWPNTFFRLFECPRSGHFINICLILIPASISDYMPSKVWMRLYNPILYNGCNYSPMIGLTLIWFSKRGLMCICVTSREMWKFGAGFFWRDTCQISKRSCHLYYTIQGFDILWNSMINRLLRYWNGILESWPLSCYGWSLWDIPLWRHVPVIIRQPLVLYEGSLEAVMAV